MSYQDNRSRPRGFGWGVPFIDDGPSVVDDDPPAVYDVYPMEDESSGNGISTATNTPSSVVEPPPGGYPRIIVHPERPAAAFALIESGWYRSPTGEVVSYRTVADYVLTAQGVDRSTLLKALGQIPGIGTGLPAWAGVAALAAVLGLLLVRR